MRKSIGSSSSRRTGKEEDADGRRDVLGSTFIGSGGVWSLPLRRPQGDVATARFLAPALFGDGSSSSSPTTTTTRKKNNNNENGGGRRQQQPRQEHRFTIAADHVETAKKLSNCHSYLYTTEIRLGTPPQPFAVGLDTSDTDLWVFGEKCDATCGTAWRRYSATNSTTMQNVTELDAKEFQQMEADFEFMSGEHVRDVLDLGNGLIVPDQVFAQINTYEEISLCEGTEGMIGLSNSPVTAFDFPSLVHNLQQPANLLKNNMFSLYLDDADDDYPAAPSDNGGRRRTTTTTTRVLDDGAGGGITTDDASGDDLTPVQDDLLTGGGGLFDDLLGTDNDEEEAVDDYYTGGEGADDDILSSMGLEKTEVITNPDAYRPVSASSEIVFGGVNHQHYTGCLVWHNVAEIDGETSQWALQIDSVQSSGKELSSSSAAAASPMVALIDTESSFVAGPAKIVGKFLTKNNVECFDMDPLGDVFAVDCAGSDGFEVAAMGCDQTVAPLSFVIDGVPYEMAAADLLTRVDTSAGEICFLRLMGLYEDESTWVFGASFVNRYYTAFDFGAGRIGLAVKTTKTTASSDKCPEDWPLDINYENVPLPPASSPALAPVAAITPPLVPTIVAPGISAVPPQQQQQQQQQQQNSSTARLVTIGVPAFLIFGAILTVTLIIFQRRRSTSTYKRADRQNTTVGSDEDYDEVELPDLL